MERVIDKLYELSYEIYRQLNVCEVDCNDQCRVVLAGKIFNSLEEAREHFVIKNGIIITNDCRNSFADKECIEYIKNIINGYIKEFYINEDKNDSFLLFIGFAINLYYIVGLYEKYGRFNIDEVLQYIESDDVKEYASLIDNYLYSLVINGIFDSYECINIKDKDKEKFINILKKIHDKYNCEDEKALYDVVERVYWNYIPEIVMFIKEGGEADNPKIHLEKMINEYPMFRFGWVYKCLEETENFYNTKGQNIEVYKLKEKIGDDLFYHVLGLTLLEEGKFEYRDRKINRIRPRLKSKFGLGIPTIQAIDKTRFYMQNIPEQEVQIVSLENIRNEVERSLGVNRVVRVDKSPIKYVSPLLLMLENKNKQLEIANTEIEKLNLQRRKMIDHLAHSWGNECYPQIVKSVADELLKSGNNTLANKLFKAYNSENNMMGEIVYLQSAMSDEPDKLKNIFQDSFFISGNQFGNQKIINILNDTLDILVFGLINYNGENKSKRSICQNSLCNKYSLKELQNWYVECFDKEKETTSMIGWFTNKVFPITINIDEEWEKINFGKTPYATIIMRNFLTELFTNMLFHGKNSCEITFFSDNQRMGIRMLNEIGNENIGNQKGLSSMEEVVEKLNYGTSIAKEKNVLFKKEEGNKFETVIILAKELMYISGEWD